MIKNNQTSYNKGFSILEVILAAGIFSIFSAAALMFMFSGLKGEQQGNNAQTALAYAREGLEAVRAIRDNSFDDMADTEGKGLDFSGGKWSLSGDHDNFDIYKRVISINAVKRDTDQNIVSGGGTDDPDMKEIISTVSWNSLSGQSVSVDLKTYLSRR